MKSILLVEDQSSGRFILSFALKEAGYEVVQAEDGRDALEKIRENKAGGGEFDLMVTDVDMPNMSGPELIDELHKLGLDLPVIVMTAVGTKHLVIELLRKGISEYIDKPFEPADLVTLVEKVFDNLEKEKEQQAEQNKKSEEEKADLLRQIDKYKNQFDKLREEIDSAKGTYQNLVQIDERSLNVNIAYRLQTLSDLGGDFIDVRNTSNGCDVIIADVAGHDLGASFHTILIKTLFEENCKVEDTGSDFFFKVNEVLLDGGRNERMVTAQFMRIDLENYMADVISAAHPYPVKIEKKFPVPRPILVKGDVLGIYDQVSYDTHSFKLTPGARLIFYTDGLLNVQAIEGETGEKTKMTADKIDEIIKANFEKPLDEMIEAIWNEVLQFSNYKYKDDMTLLGIEIPER